MRVTRRPGAAFVLTLALGLAALLGEGVWHSTAWGQEELFVSNLNNSITVYSRTASGDTAPIRTLSGAATGLSGPQALAVDTVNNELAVVNEGPFPFFFPLSSITVYTRTVSGNTAPIRTLSGSATALASPFGVVVDTVNNELVVANLSDGITVYTRTASGNTPPIRT